MCRSLSDESRPKYHVQQRLYVLILQSNINKVTNVIPLMTLTTYVKVLHLSAELEYVRLEMRFLEQVI